MSAVRGAVIQRLTVVKREISMASGLKPEGLIFDSMHKQLVELEIWLDADADARTRTDHIKVYSKEERMRALASAVAYRKQLYKQRHSTNVSRWVWAACESRLRREAKYLGEAWMREPRYADLGKRLAGAQAALACKDTALAQLKLRIDAAEIAVDLLSRVWLASEPEGDL